MHVRPISVAARTKSDSRVDETNARNEKKARRAAKQQEDQPKQKEKPNENKEGEKKDADKKEDEVKTIKRPTDKPNPLDVDRVKIQTDANGLVQFSYNGHPWPTVMQDYAGAARLTFDWQELPADYLNLITQRKYSLLEARDLLNRHLLARGFTMIVHGELLSVVKIDKLDPSLIPRVSPDDLEDYPPYDFVRVRFDLPQSMDPAKAKEDVTVLLSPNAKVTPLLATKRLLVIDAADQIMIVIEDSHFGNAHQRSRTGQRGERSSDPPKESTHRE